MESTVIFRDRQELQSADLNAVQEFTQSSIDHIVLDTIEDGRAYSGFEASKTGAAEVTVDQGRLYSLGLVYARNEAVVLDLFNVLPLVTKKRVAIVAYGTTTDTDVQPRDFLVDAQTGATEPQSVAMESARHCEVSTVAGAEAADPTYPTTDANLCVIAYVLLDTTGVVSIEQWDENKVLNLRGVGDRTGLLEDWRTQISGRVDTLGTDLASLAQRLPSYALDTSLQALALIVKQLQEQLSKPAAYLYHAIQKFTDTADAETGASGYSALIAQGLRFPYTASDTVTLALLNPNDPNVSYYSGLCLPYHIHLLRLDCKHYHRQHRCGQHTWHGHNCHFWRHTRHRWRCGPEWLGWLNGTWVVRELEDALKKALHENLGTWTDQTYRDFIDNVREDFPRAWLRTKYSTAFWRDFVDDFYWSNVKTTSTLTAYHVGQTFLVSQDAWLSKVGLYFSQLAASGDVDIMICETDATGKPDITKVLSRTTVARASLQVGTGSGGAGLPSIVETAVTINPVLLKAGKRYGMVLAVQGDHWLAMSDEDAGVVQGACFAYQSGAWAVQTGVVKFRLYFGQWTTGRTVIDLQPLQLAGGIRSLDFLGEIAIPGATNFTFEVQIGGVWYPVDGSLDLSTLPAILPLRIVFLGSTDLMPSIFITQCRCKVARAATAFKYVSKTRALGGNAAKIVLKIRMDGFNDAVHDLTATVKTNGGLTTETADTVADVTLPDGRIERTATFNIAAENDYYYVLDGALSSINSQFVVTDIEEVATA
jgi:hypothetical protein